ncbi:hypothetical protein PAT3040_02648 [Paenibacillus agaridevorans]|uniref:Uncharacterized protein n=1 Tax=Paenibacillus agaridevorans TaxID=171404 RepID=A0A2R5EXK5_9BACL|nr:hypothetical protein [Paenibacillus agaridevorans]GBG08081.1 hypothetical protein PAT3040_02648 [Paenibacillus agaridevorans]
MKKWSALLFLVAFLLSWNGAEVNAATVTVNSVYATHANDHSTGGYVYSDQSSKKVSINIASNPGFIIKNLFWEKEDGTLLRSAPGAWSGKESYVGEDTLSGTPVMVKTLDSQTWGGIYYWDRSGGSNLWRATANNIRYENSSTCPSAPADSWGYKAYPNCTDDLLSLKLTKNGSYHVNGNLALASLPDKVVAVETIKPVDIMTDHDMRVANSVHGGQGYADPSTQYLGRFEVESKNSIRVFYQQNFGSNSLEKGYYKDWANPGARQMWWYAAFTFRLEATTYQYKDKRLVVEWQSKENEVTQLNVRHMVRKGPTGNFAKAAESVTPLAEPLPHTRTVSADASYGKVVGRNVAYNQYSNTVQTGNSVTVNLSSAQKSAYVTFFYEVSPPAFTGDFDIIPDTINYRESFALKPKDFVMNGCTFQSHRYKIERNGTFTTSPVAGQNTTTSYSYSNYPWIIGVGSHTVSINIKTSCGESGWINHKTLTVNDMAGNRPPQFRIGFVHPQAQTIPLYEVVEGTILNLIYIQDPSVPTPIDPDGDSLHFMGFDTENGNQFIQSLPQRYSEYTNGYHSVVMDTLGYHHVTAQMRDEWGLASTASTYIKVVPKNPIAIALCPPVVKSGRTIVGSLFDASRSYSPLGRTIDHAKNEWTNKKTIYTNTTNLNIIETVQLHVYDSVGLKSLDPGVCQIIVEPDQPPVAKLEVPSLAIRNQDIDIYNRSFSPDNDKIVSAEYRYKYDAANDGFENDNWKTINASSKLSFTFKPSKVGKYLFYTKVTEDYGQTDDTLDETEELLMLDVINDAPTISFDLEGQNNQPELDPHEFILPADILKDWKLYDINSNTLGFGKSVKWFMDGDVLSGGTGKLPENLAYRSMYRSNINNNYSWSWPFQNLGFGKNNLSPYRAMTSMESAKMQPLLVEKSGKLQAMQFGGQVNPQMKVYSNESHFYFTEPSRESGDSFYFHLGMRFYAANKSKIGRYKGTSHATNGYDLNYIHEWLDGSPYDFELGPHNIMTAGPTPTFDAYVYKDSKKILSEATYLGKKNFTQSNIRNYVVTDKTVYQIVNWDCGGSCSYYWYNGDRIYDYGTYVDIRAYDAFTGEFISSTLDNQILTRSASPYLTIGDHLIVVSYDSNTNVLYELNRDGEIVRQSPYFGRAPYTEQKPYTNYNRTCTVGLSEPTADLDGWYFMEPTYCRDPDGFTYPKEIHIIKVSQKDLSVVWRTKLAGNYSNMEGSYSHEVGDPADGYSNIVVNPFANELLVNSFNPNGFGMDVYYQCINTRTGAISTWNAVTNGYFGSASTGFEIGWNGAYNKLAADFTRYSNLWTAEGWKTLYSSSRTASVRDTAGAVRYSFQSSAILWVNFMYIGTLEVGKFGMYVGDGMYMSFSNTTNANYSDFAPVLHVGTPTTDPLVYDAFSLGQFVSDNKLPDAELIYTMTMHQPAVNDDLAGMSFRMSNPLNRYAVENDGTTVYLSKYVNGVRTIIDQKPFITQKGIEYNFKVQFIGENIKVHINKVPYFDVKDNQFDDGYFGMFSDKGLVDFAKIGFLLKQQDTWSTQYAIWEEDNAAAAIRTDNVLFEDPEDDSIAELGWSLFHTVRFINNQGLSNLHNKSIEDGYLLLDKVGDYKIALKGRDDPHLDYLMPDLTFDAYRKDSNEFVRNITVHRRPIADFDVVQGESDGLILWTDRSHDPDRYESATHYSDEDTGIDYRATKGILEKRFYYITPAGEYVAEKIVSPQEVGQYEIGLAVKDEYGAWSTWAVRTLDVGKVAVPNTPPTPGFTKSHTTTYRGVTVTINSTASDAEDGGRENLAHTYYVRNKTANGGETIRSNSRTSWTTTFNQLGTYKIRQFVEDSAGANAQNEQEINVINRKPVANLTVPASTNQNSPTKMTVLRPEFRWTYSDADNDRQQRYQVQIYRYGGILLHDSDAIDGAEVTWTPSIDLPEKTNMYVQVRAHDGYEWGNWSTVRYFYIETNQPPTADFTWLPNPVYEGDTVTFRSIVSDPDRDTLSIKYELTDPRGIMTTYNYSLQPTGATYPNTGPSLRMLQVGNWHMRMTVNDGKAPAVAVNKTVLVQELSITGQVTHTEDWEKHRLAWNEKNPGQERSVSTFWAGERFVLSAQTTNTGTSTTRATRVDVSVVGIGNTQLGSTNTLHWSGHIGNQNADKPIEKLSNGYYEFVFRVTYSNGIQKSTTVRITIAGHWTDYFKLHQGW